MSSTHTRLTKLSYCPELNEITGGPLHTIAALQIRYRWQQSGGLPFYKFSMPCTHPLYRNGESWTEELGFSPAQWRTILKVLGHRQSSASPKTSSEHFFSYRTDADRVTWWTWNEDLWIALDQQSSKKDGDQLLSLAEKIDTYIYMMEDRHTGLVKIGHSKDPGYRERTLQSQKPSIRMLGAWPGSRLDETRLHSMYSHKRKRGEWFALRPADIDVVRAYCQSIQPSAE